MNYDGAERLLRSFVDLVNEAGKLPFASKQRRGTVRQADLMVDGVNGDSRWPRSGPEADHGRQPERPPKRAAYRGAVWA